MSKEELLRQLEDFAEDELEAALRAATALRKTKSKELYFLHYFFQEERIDDKENGFTVKLPIDTFVKNPLGMVHGGVTAFLVDNAMGFASFMEKGRPGVTLDLNIRYHKPGAGKWLVAKGEVVSSGSLMNSMRTEVRDDAAEIVATATGTFYHRLPK